MSLVIKLNGVKFDNPDLPTLDGDSLIGAGFIDVEPGAIGHWLLGGNETSYKDLTAFKHDLTEPGSKPLFTDRSVKLTIAASLDSGIQFGEGDAATFCVVFKKSGSNMPIGTLQQASTNTVDGVAIFSDSTSVHMNGRSENNILQDSLNNVPNDAYIFVAVSIGNDKTVLYCPQAADPAKGTISVVDAPGANAYAPRNVYLGPSHYGVQFNEVFVAESIIFNRALTQYELEAIYNRSKYRMSKRGVTI